MNKISPISLLSRNHFRCFRNFCSSHSHFFSWHPPSQLSRPTSFSYFYTCVFFHPRPLSSSTSVVHFHCLFSSCCTAARTSTSKTNMKSNSSQTNSSITSCDAHSFKGCNLHNSRTINWQRIKQWNNSSFNPPFFFFKINIFLLSSKKIPFEQYYRLHISGPDICETMSSNVFVLAHMYLPIDQNNLISYMQYKKL